MFSRRVNVLIVCHFAVYAQDPIVNITETVPTRVNNIVNAMQTDDVTLSCQVENLPTGLKVCYRHNYFCVLTHCACFC